ncbi:unnamed protein product [Linum tenue]|uniref:Uncharacterized protein n=1 Tax=Linum tenue TaxID=586396 RepID=A0AAV0NMT1_9ROSI|nr:unnamed protein product [Linum tenue]
MRVRGGRVDDCRLLNDSMLLEPRWNVAALLLLGTHFILQFFLKN